MVQRARMYSFFNQFASTGLTAYHFSQTYLHNRENWSLVWSSDHREIGQPKKWVRFTDNLRLQQQECPFVVASSSPHDELVEGGSIANLTHAVRNHSWPGVSMCFCISGNQTSLALLPFLRGSAILSFSGRSTQDVVGADTGLCVPQTGSD